MNFVPDWQPTLTGSLIRLHPLSEDDFESLYQAASDPLIWEQHPDRERHTRERFQVYFRSGVESKGAFVISDQVTGQIIGSSRFTDYNQRTSSVEIGYTFFTRPYWGTLYNRELKSLMLNHAFQFVETAYFVVGHTNYRSQRAMTKLGAIKVTHISSTPLTGDLTKSVTYQITKENWLEQCENSRSFEQPLLHTERLALEPITENHAQELCDLFSDLELHRFIPFEPLSLEKQKERCSRWAKRKSPDGSELWLNWAGRDNPSGKIIAHFQAGVKADGIASIAYLVARDFQGKGIAIEGLKAVFKYLQETLAVKEIKAWSDTRNQASHRLAQKLGMVQVEFIKDADFFKGATSDEFVFSKIF